MKLHSTPWGKPQQQHEFVEGIIKVSTAGHGGIYLSAERRAAMPAAYRDVPTFAGGNWYEEDCDWALVALSFPEHFDAAAIQTARDTLAWLLQNSERFARKGAA